MAVHLKNNRSAEEFPTVSSSSPGDRLAARSVVFVLNRLANGGAEKQLLLLARYLSEAGFKCRILPLAPNRRHRRIERLVDEALSAGVRVDQPDGSSIFKQLLRFKKSLKGSTGGFVWSWGTRADLFCKIALLGDKRLSLLCSLRDANETHLERYAAAHRFLTSRVARYISNTWLNAQMLENIVPRSLPKCRVVYNCLEQQELDRPPVDLSARPDLLQVVVLGNIHPYKKGYDHLIELASRIKELHLPIHISVAGRDDTPNWIQDRIAERQIGSVLTYVGESNEPEQFLRGGQVFLLSSRQEGTPNALLEAMCLGLPCITTRVGDIDRITTNGKNVVQVDVGDVNAMSNALQSFLADWQRAGRLGAAARNLCLERFTPGCMLNATLQILSEIAPAIQSFRSGDLCENARFRPAKLKSHFH